jgi:cytochrome c-type biogenesis protein CcmH
MLIRTCKVGFPIWLLGVALYFGGANLTHAVVETYDFNDSTLELRYKQLSAELRCPKCQNQNIAASDAPIARDLRKLLHRQLQAGDSDEEILQYMVARYGEFVLYRPRFEGVTLLLWLFPVVLLFAAGLMVYRVIGGASAVAEQVGESSDPLDFETVLARKINEPASSESNS